MSAVQGKDMSSVTSRNAPYKAKQIESDKPEPIWWFNGAFIIFVHVVSILALLFYTPAKATIWLTYISWHLSTFGITVGYHRLWSHKAYTARLPLRAALAFMGTLAFQGSIKWWVLRHRLHHRYTDSDHDPYSATKGFWFSHMGWIFAKPHYPRMKLIDQSDLNADPVVVFQHKYYVPLALGSGLILPTIIAAFWGDAIGGYLYAGMLGRLLVWHSTFCINSFAHWAGDRLYSNEVSARGNLLLAVLTNGEGYHNFHHEFPKDYRNGHQWFDYDPSKWVIWFFHRFTSQVPSLQRVPDNEISKARAQMMAIEAAELEAKVQWPADSDALPVMTVEELRASREEGKSLFAIDGFVLDVEDFRSKHPGGEQLLKTYFGKDATRAFYGGLNQHTKAARNMVGMLRVARLETKEASKEQ